LKNIVILGGGVSGLATDFFLKDNSDFNLIGFEKNAYFGGHAHSWVDESVTWDEGVHIFFGKESEASPFFDFSNDAEQDAIVMNYADGDWIPHPAYVNLCSVSNPSKDLMLKSLIDAEVQKNPSTLDQVQDYREWLVAAYGESYAKKFPIRYNQKYWKVEPESMGTEWIFPRLFVPSIEQIKSGSISPQSMHYIKKFRYPNSGGYSSYFKHSLLKSSINFSEEIKSIDIENKIVRSSNRNYPYDVLVNSIPLANFIKLIPNVPSDVEEASSKLECTSMLLVNLQIEGRIQPYFHWAYIHDKNLVSTRITNYCNLVTPNTGTLQTNLQVEVYESKDSPFTLSHDEIAQKVASELRDIGLIPRSAKVNYKTHYAKYANVMFLKNRLENLEIIYNYLSKFGLTRDKSEFSPNFSPRINEYAKSDESIFLIGRFAQWNYYWTHDCVNRAREISNIIQRLFKS
jgi:protoporphyrinogen oxidase